MRRLLLLSLLAGSAWPVHAAPVTWDFSYTGFFSSLATSDRFEGDTYTEGFDPAARITGRFSGEDRNGDGILALDELSMFVLRDRDYFDCIAHPSPYTSCSIGSFRYDLEGGLDFAARWGGADEFYSGWSGSVTSGVGATDYYYNNFFESTRKLAWTDQTRFSIVQLPVPEPGGAAMAAAGLLLLAARRRRSPRR